ncbi:MAG: hypothetical protein K0Q59_1960 [Paenibacillus sp.]|jgi:hypothetical protein|nr:hypothetical protein [Paenibacillus sp.]
MSNTKRVTKWWWAWEPERLELWLEQMAAQGWHLVKVKWGATRFYFEKGEPQQVRFGLDYQTKQDPNYKVIFQDAGWEFMYGASGWYIWKMPYSGTRPAIYTDLDSMIERNNRLMGLLIVVIAAQITVFSTALDKILSMPVLMCIYIALVALLAYSLWRMSSTNSRLKKRKSGMK